MSLFTCSHSTSDHGMESSEVKGQQDWKSTANATSGRECMKIREMCDI